MNAQAPAEEPQAPVTDEMPDEVVEPPEEPTAPAPAPAEPPTAVAEAEAKPEKTPQGLLSIERFVAFILGPVVVAGAGWLSTFLAREIGIKLSQETIVVVFSSAALGAAALAYKWLHGRQVEMQVKGAVQKAEAIPGVGGLIHTTLDDLEGLAQTAVARTVTAIHGGEPPPPTIIPPAEHDPAPATSSGNSADVGAASQK